MILNFAINTLIFLTLCVCVYAYECMHVPLIWLIHCTKLFSKYTAAG